MPLSWNEIRQRAVTFSRQWSDATKENAEAQTFWNEFFAVFGKSRRAVASFEASVKSLEGTPHRIDLFWPGRMIGESKSRGKDLDHAQGQAVGYITDLINNGREAETPRYVLTTDFARLTVRDLEPDKAQDLFDLSADATVEFPLRDLHRHIRRFAFIAGYDTQQLDPEDPANIQAAELLANVHDRLEESGYQGHDLQRFMVRVLFCLFAEDTGIFEPDAFKQFLLHHTKEDGADLGPQLARFFQVLNTPRDRRQTHLPDDLAELPYVNGRLFEEQLAFADFSAPMRQSLLVAAGFRWETISPAVFGSLFQSIMEPKARRQIGAHYTSERDILKLCRSLFLDRLTDRLNRCAAPRDFEGFLDHLRSLKFLDPACGCGNFLVIAFRELRRLEMDALNALTQRHGEGTLGLGQSRIPVSHFHGLELEEWPALIAEVAMWLMDHQLNNEQFARFGSATPTVPLQDSPNIRCANALTTDWATVLPPEECSYIMGNPPFSGKDKMTDAQRLEVAELTGSGVLDYVAAWYHKSTHYINDHPIAFAFVSTNSITQGEQVSPMFDPLFSRGYQILFGHRTFQWESEARGKAHVHVVIVGLARDNGLINSQKTIIEYDRADGSRGNSVAARNITPYLTEGSSLSVRSRTKPLMDVPSTRYGSKPVDGGHLIVEDNEKADFLDQHPCAKVFIRPLLCADEYLDGRERWCIWLENASPREVRACNGVVERLEAVRNYRARSKKQKTKDAALTPGRFAEIRQPQENFLVIPLHSSERRNVIPFGYYTPEYIVHNSCSSIPGATLYHFGVLHSAMHMAWVRQVCGRLESRYRYSAKLVYNNFPWPAPEDVEGKKHAAVEAAARAVLDAREPHLSGGATLADLYDPLAMPADLAKAHAALDRVVDRCYRPQPFPDERRRFEFLFQRYEQLTAPLTATPKKKRGRKKTS
jgi:hypothetical protein